VNSTEVKSLGQLSRGGKGIISRLGSPAYSSTMVERLMQMGLLEGAFVEVMHEAPFGKDPIAVKVRGALIALRRHEANAIEVLSHE
jgi:ferrous iron transport protein A